MPRTRRQRYRLTVEIDVLARDETMAIETLHANLQPAVEGGEFYMYAFTTLKLMGEEE